MKLHAEGTRMPADQTSTLLFAMQGTPLDQAAGAVSSGSGTATAPAGGAGGAPPPVRGGDSTIIFLVLGLLVVMILMTTFTGRRQRKQREAMLGALRKHDRVMTTGGIIGSVVEIKPRTVVLKVDESSNTRITFSRESIQQVIEEAAETSGGEART